MIRASDNIFVGNSKNEMTLEVGPAVFRHILNVAADLAPTRSWKDGVEYRHVGLVDGPGNTLSSYCAAVLALHSLAKRGKTLVCCHEGRSRSLSIAVMYLNTVDNRGWDEWLTVLRELNDFDIPAPHVAHLEAFHNIDWKALSRCMEG